jgi:hypothetical protein
VTEPPRRVRVTGPRTAAVRRQPGRQTLRALDEQDVVGELLIRSLMRAQLTLALRVALVFGVFLGGFPLLCALIPATARVDVAGLPMPWLVLGVLVYPSLLAGGWFYVRGAERNERDFVDLVDRR